MLTNSKTDERILGLIRKGAKLIVYVFASGECDGCPVVWKVGLQHGRRELTLATRSELRDERISIDDRLLKTGELRRGYCYVGDYDQRWREIYEHISTPTPRWVTEQWDNPATMYPLP